MAYIHADPGSIWEYHMTVSNARTASDGTCDALLRKLDRMEKRISREVEAAGRQIDALKSMIAAEMKKDEPDYGIIGSLQSEIAELEGHVRAVEGKSLYVRSYRDAVILKRNHCLSAFQQCLSFLDRFVTLLDSVSR